MAARGMAGRWGGGAILCRQTLTIGTAAASLLLAVACSDYVDGRHGYEATSGLLRLTATARR